MSTRDATTLLNDSLLLKSDGGHKYVKREGSPGNYKYTYADGSTGSTEHKPTFSLTASAHQGSLFGSGAYEKKPKAKAVDPAAQRQTDMFAPKPAAAEAGAPSAYNAASAAATIASHAAKKSGGDHEAHAAAGHAHTEAMVEAQSAGDEKAAARHRKLSEEHHAAAYEASQKAKGGSGGAKPSATKEALDAHLAYNASRKKTKSKAATHASHVADAAAAKEDAVDHAHGVASKATSLSTAANRLSNAGGEMGSANHQAAHEAHKAAAAANREAAEAFKQPGASVSIGGRSFASLHEDRAKTHDEKAGDHWREAVKARSDEEGEDFGQAATHKVGGEAKTSLDKHHEAVAGLKPAKMSQQGHFDRAHAKIKALHDHLEDKLGFHPATAHAKKALTAARYGAESPAKVEKTGGSAREIADAKSYARGNMVDAINHAKAAFDAASGHNAFKKSMDHVEVEAGISRFQDRSAGPPPRAGVYDGLASGMIDPTVDRPRYAGRAPNQVIGVDGGVVAGGAIPLAYQKPRRQSDTVELAKSAMREAIKAGYRHQLMLAEDSNPVAKLVTRNRLGGEIPSVPAELRKSVQLGAVDADAVIEHAASLLAAESQRNNVLHQALSLTGVSRRNLRETFDALGLTPTGVLAGY